MGIQGVIGQTVQGTAIANAFLVALQKIDYDLKGTDNVAFLFAFRGEDTVELKSDITDHFIEDNTAVQDQIALRPKEITLHGYIGELTNSVPGFLKQINALASRLTVLSPYVPQLTAQATIAYNQALSVYNSLAAAVVTVTQAYNMFANGDLQTKQQKAFGYFEDKFDNRALFKVQTPWKIFENMAIVSMRAVQEEDNSTMSDFIIQLKEIRFAETIASDLSIAQGRAAAQKSSVVDKGFQSPPATADLSSILSGQGVQKSIFG